MNSIVISSCLTLVVTAPEVRCHVPQQEQFAEDGQSARVSMLYGRWHSHAGPNKGNPSRVIAILSLSPDAALSDICLGHVARRVRALNSAWIFRFVR
jgi:hypothetical protein